MTQNSGIVNLSKGVYLNVRENPNFFSNILGAIAPGTNLDILEQNGEWFKISYEGKDAYVFGKAVKTTGDIIQGGISLNLNVPNDFKIGVTGNKSTFDCNAYVKNESIPILNENGDPLKGSYTSKGDYITIIKDNPKANLTFIQYPSQSNNIYKQGWIKSSYISNDYLEFRFKSIWTNLINGQKIYLFDNTISKITLNINSKYTLLYTITNFNQTYACILFKDSNNKLKIGFVPFSSGKLEFLLATYPYNISNGSSIGNSEPTVKSNAISTAIIQLIDINGININNRKIQKGVNIAILQIFVESQKVLIEYYDSNFNNYVKGYVNIDDLHKKLIKINKNSVIWNDKKGTFDVFDLSGNTLIYKMPADQTIQYLYSTKDFACILYNNHKYYGYPIQTGFVKLSNGKFKN